MTVRPSDRPRHHEPWEGVGQVSGFCFMDREDEAQRGIPGSLMEAEQGGACPSRGGGAGAPRAGTLQPQPLSSLGQMTS